jgi:hypothetical protein
MVSFLYHCQDFYRTWLYILAKNTTHKIKKDDQHWPHQKPEWTQVLAKSKQFLLLISHLPCYSYIQSSPVKVLAVIEERNHLRTHSYLCDYSTNRRNIWLTYIIIPLFASTWVHSGFWWGQCWSSFLILCVVFFALFVFVLYLAYPMLSVSLDCPFFFAPSVFSNVYLI